MKRSVIRVTCLCTCLALAGAAQAQLTIPGADGSDGALSPQSNTTIDLSAAPTGSWNGANQNPGAGVYDASLWAVVYRYSSVSIPSTAVVTFANHPSCAPVVWLVNGDVTIVGTVYLGGESSGPARHTRPGPGGFRGGIGLTDVQTPASGGFGPGGAFIGRYSTASYGTLGTNAGNRGPTYGNASVIPLIGGSGGGGYHENYFNSHLSGGAGGGAMLIAATGRISITGAINANGGNGNASGNGSGGAIRIVAHELVGSGRLRAVGGTADNNQGGFGRIRIEANLFNQAAALDVLPQTRVVAPTNPATLWPPAQAPTARVLSIAGIPVPSDPRGNIDLSGADVNLNRIDPVDVVVETTNLPPSSTINVRIIPKFGQPSTQTAMFTAGNTVLATWTLQTTLPSGFFAVQVRALLP